MPKNSITTSEDEKIVKLNVPKHFPLGTPKEEIIEQMENAKEGDTFTMSLALTNKGWADPAAKEQRDELLRKRDELRRKAKEIL